MTNALDEIHRLFAEGTLAGLSDGELLERFAVRGDGEAFAAIVARHGAMVLSVCQSALGPRGDADAEDAFQATFLVLVRRAGSFPLHGSLSGWLYRVARRVARQARIEASRRRARERIATVRGDVEPPPDPARDELRRLVNRELAELPERYRMPILLCDLNGLTRDEAAAAIGCPPGTVAGRLARAREQLRGRLARRGVTSASAWPAALGVPADDLLRLFQRASHAAVTAARGEAVATVAAQLAARASRSLFTARIATALTLLIALGACGAAVAVLTSRNHGGPRAMAPTPQAPAEAQAPIDPDDPATADLFAGRVVDTEGKPLDGVKLYLMPVKPVPTKPGEVRAVTAGGGRFRFSAKDLTFTAEDGLPARRPGLLIASAAGYGPDWVQTWGETGSTFVSHYDPIKGAEWTLTLVRDDVPIRGLLLDPDGRPLAGAAVTLTGLYVPSKKDLTAHLEKQKVRQTQIFGQAYDRSLETAGVLPDATTETVTDADGRFRLGGLGRDRLAHLRIRGSGVVETSIEVMTRRARDVHRRRFGISEGVVTYGAAFTLELGPGRTVTGVVRDKTAGTPLADVWIGTRFDALEGLMTGRYPHATDARGRFAFSGIAPDLENLEVLAVPKPGQPFFLASALINDAGEAVVECTRGIPFRLTLRDQAGRPVDADVTYSAIAPNAFFEKLRENIVAQAGSPLSRAARQADGTYLGVALPGPGVVLAETPRKAGYRPAEVDPKAFFAPGKTEWTQLELVSNYGSRDSLTVATFVGIAGASQHAYAAIVLVNPAEGAKPLELSATVGPDKPRQVTVLDPEGRPLVGVRATGLSSRWARDLKLRAATVPIRGLPLGQARRITFVKDDRKLIGSLLARADGGSPYIVRMQPWAAVTGRVVNDQGKPQAQATLAAGATLFQAADDDPEVAIFPTVTTDEHGRFHAERLIPGQSYSADLYLGPTPGGPARTAFEGVKLAPGEVRDLGDLRAKSPGTKP